MTTSTAKFLLLKMVQRAKSQRQEAIRNLHHAKLLNKISRATYPMHKPAVFRSASLVYKWQQRAEKTTALLINLQTMQMEEPNLPLFLQQQVGI